MVKPFNSVKEIYLGINTAELSLTLYVQERKLKLTVQRILQ